MKTGNPPRVAMVGAGYWGRNLARNFAELGALAAIVDSHPETAAKVSAETGARVCDFDDLLNDRDIAGIAIATSAPTHYAVAKAALERGKHVFVEKPLTLDQGEAAELIELAGRQDKVLMVGHLLRHHPVFQKMLEVVRSGSLGAVRYIYSDRMSLGKVRAEEDVLWSFAPHDISMVIALAGSEPYAVTAQGADFLQAGIADVTTLQLAFASGVKASIRASWMHVRKTQQLVAVCERATIIFEDSLPHWEDKLVIHWHDVDMIGTAPVPKRGEVEQVEVEFAEPLKCECRHFLNAIAEGSQPLTDGQEGLAVLAILQSASDSLSEYLKFNQVGP